MSDGSRERISLRPYRYPLNGFHGRRISPSAPTHDTCEVVIQSSLNVERCYVRITGRNGAARLGMAVMADSPRELREQVQRLIRTKGSIAGLTFVGGFRELEFPPGTDLSRVNMNHSNLCGACIDGCKLVGARFAQTEMNRLSARGIDATDADFSQSIAQNSDWTGSNLTRARYDGAQVCGATFLECALVETSFWRAWLQDASFDRGISQALVSEAVGLTMMM